MVCVILVDAFLVALGYVRRGSDVSPLHKPFNNQLYAIDVAIESVAIAVAIALFRRTRRSDLIAPSTAVIVGLHFIGLWVASGLNVFLFLAAGLTVVGALAMLPGLETISEHRGLRNPRLALCGFGSSLVLWTGCALSIPRH